ncbi:putative serine-protein kinase ATM-like, partial [Apostichopus japonicus]
NQSISLTNLQICTLKNLQTAVATVDIPVDLNCRYGNIVTIQKFELTFKLAGGINLPKIIKCIGSDGVTRRQLVKGKDDLRQDAVMQQVFGLVNHLLAQNPETRQRQLHIRRYKVVPLSQRSGILEWCEGTVPLGLYLLGNQKTDFGAHKRYRPDDKTSLQCRRLMQTTDISFRNGYIHPDRNWKKSIFWSNWTFLIRTLAMATLDIEHSSKSAGGHFKPVFRHFFFEKFLEPAVWFEKRLAYSKKRRNMFNSWVRGVAFEQGRILPTPETIPFRLTRDLVDGMGVAGVEGVFRRCCEKTMEVMRHNQEALLAVLEDELSRPPRGLRPQFEHQGVSDHHYEGTPKKDIERIACAVVRSALRTGPCLHEGPGPPEATNKLEQTAWEETQTPRRPSGNMSSINIDQMEHHGRSRYQAEQNKEEVNTVAERALLRLRQKLQGLEEGVTLSVSGQINHLIQEARDPKNLCRVFPGWQPWV